MSKFSKVEGGETVPSNSSLGFPGTSCSFRMEVSLRLHSSFAVRGGGAGGWAGEGEGGRKDTGVYGLASCQAHTWCSIIFVE